MVYGLAVYAAFLVTFLYAIGFVGDLVVPKAIDTGAGALTAAALVIDVVLLGIFALQHSVMARQGFKRVWTRIVPGPVERSTYVLLATAALALLLWQWRPIGGAVWAVKSPVGADALWVVFWLGWAMLLLSTFLIDHFDLFGLRQVSLFARGQPYRLPDFQTRGLYRYLRHPIMLGFIIAFWAAPVMTVGHLLFAIASTGYILVGIAFEERDLLQFYGERYRNYRHMVPMLIPGLGRFRPLDAANESGQAGPRR